MHYIQPYMVRVYGTFEWSPFLRVKLQITVKYMRSHGKFKTKVNRITNLK